MNETNGLPHPDFTPEQKAAIYAKYKKLFSVEDLIGYIEDNEPVYPFDQVLEEVDQQIRDLKKRKAEAK